MRRLFIRSGFTSLAAILLVSVLFTGAAAAFNKNLLISDFVFDQKGSMSAAQINSFLNRFGSSCISTHKGFSSIDPSGYSPSGGFTYGGYVSAGTVIAHAAQAYDINPKVLLTTLQKEQSLVTGTSGCSKLQYVGAMGYGCPDGGSTHSYSGAKLYKIGSTVYSSVSGTCVNTKEKAGFSQQVIHAAWLLKFGEQRSKGNIGWAIVRGNWNNSDDPETCYSGPMTRGTYHRCPSDTAVFFDGYTTIDSVSTFMGSGGTASLYWYTPHFHGNQNFVSIYTGWFGPPTGGCNVTANVDGASAGKRFLNLQYGGGAESLVYTQQNNTGSTCAEDHVWNAGFKSWRAHIATAMAASDPATGRLMTGNWTGNDRNDQLFIKYSGSGGNAEIHKFSTDLQYFPGIYDVATNLGGVTSTNGGFVSGDFLKSGHGQLAFVSYSGAGGKAEVHVFDSSLKKGAGYHDTLTNLSGITTSTGMFVAGDFLGRGYAQIAYIVYSGAGGHVEVHLLDPSLHGGSGYYDVLANLSGVTPASGTFVAGDFLGRGYDQLVYVQYNGGSGKVETHMFSHDLRKATGIQDIATNMNGF